MLVSAIHQCESAYKWFQNQILFTLLFLMSIFVAFWTKEVSCLVFYSGKSHLIRHAHTVLRVLESKAEHQASL